MVEAKSQHHFFGNSILLGFARGAPIGVGAEALVQVTAVVVDQVVAAVDDLFGDEVGGAFSLGAVGFAGVEAIHALVVDGVYVRNFLQERRDVDERKQDDGAGELSGIDGRDQFFHRDDGGVFRAVGAGD